MNRAALSSSQRCPLSVATIHNVPGACHACQRRTRSEFEPRCGSQRALVVFQQDRFVFLVENSSYWHFFSLIKWAFSSCAGDPRVAHVNCSCAGDPRAAPTIPGYSSGAALSQQRSHIRDAGAHVFQWVAGRRHAFQRQPAPQILSLSKRAKALTKVAMPMSRAASADYPPGAHDPAEARRRAARPGYQLLQCSCETCRP